MKSVSFQSWKNNQFGKTNIYEYKRYNYNNIDWSNCRPQVDWLRCPYDDASLVTLYPFSRALPDIKIDSQRTIHPSVDTANCVLLSVANPAYPEWLAVPCDQKILTEVICLGCFEKTGGLRHTDFGDVNRCILEIENKSIVSRKKKHCSSDMILLLESCFLFHHFDGKYSNLHKVILRGQSGTKTVKVFEETNWLEQIIKAIGVKLVAIISPKLHNNFYVTSHTFDYIWLRIIHQQEKINTRDARGFLIFEDVVPDTNSEIYKPLTFQCSTGEMVSSVFQCSETNDCASPAEKNICNWSRLFFQVFSSKAETFTRTMPSQISEGVNATFVCQDNNSISMSQVDDLIPDCRNAEDEQIVHGTVARHYQSECFDPNNIPCKTGHPLCFHLTDICVYRLNKLGDVVPCRTGSHMEECRSFQCNGKHKCPNYYCVPYTYVCDGKWDCPTGNDESPTCAHPRQCKYLYRCHKSEVCIHILDICNNILDCPQEEDEMMCELLGTVCPKDCHCFHFALMCVKVELGQSDFVELAYYSLYISSCDINSTQFFHAVDNVKILSLPFNKVTSVCLDMKYYHALQVLNLTMNKISSLVHFCFFNQSDIKSITLKQNLISTVRTNAFHSLQAIELIDMTDNNLDHLSKHTFVNITSKFVLVLLGNSLISFDVPVFQNAPPALVNSDCPIVCCIFPQGNFCKSQLVTCNNLIPKWYLQFLLNTSAVMLLLLSVTAWGTPKRSKIHCQGKGGKGAFYSIVQFFAFPNSFLAGYFAMIVIADERSDDTESGYFNSIAWKGSTICFILFCSMLIFFLAYAFLTTIMSVARYRVVKNPFSSRFKSERFVNCLLSGVFILTVFMGVLVTFVVAQFTENNYFCFPLLRSADLSVSVSVMSSIACIQVTCLLLETIGSCFLIKELNINPDLKKRKDKQTPNKYVIRKLLIFVISHFLCWVPSLIVYFLSSFHLRNADELSLLTMTLITPFASFTNPFILIDLSSFVKIFSKKGKR